MSVKKLLRDYLPWLYASLRAIYGMTPLAILKRNRQKKERLISLEFRKKRNAEIMADVFSGDYRVANGPFMGMKYIESSAGSALLPKILGSYEEPIHGWVETAIAKGYDKILDIGCAEGYYAAGFAMRLPATKIFAYDSNPAALELCRELAALNGLGNVETKQICDFQELDDQISGHTLVFCDIEGAERELLDPARATKLKFTDLMIESHDSFMPGTTNMLIERFGDTHKISVAVDYPGRLKTYKTPNDAPSGVMDEIINENRAKLMRFLYCESFTVAE